MSAQRMVAPVERLTVDVLPLCPVSTLPFTSKSVPAPLTFSSFSTPPCPMPPPLWLPMRNSSFTSKTPPRTFSVA